MLRSLLVAALAVGIPSSLAFPQDDTSSSAGAAAGAGDTPTGAPVDFDAQCKAFAKKTFDQTKIYFTEIVKAGTTLPLPDNNVTCALSSQFVPQDICRIAMFVSTSSRSGINMEAWFPRNWTGRYMTTGNGGVSGCKFCL